MVTKEYLLAIYKIAYAKQVGTIDLYLQQYYLGQSDVLASMLLRTTDMTHEQLEDFKKEIRDKNHWIKKAIASID